MALFNGAPRFPLREVCKYCHYDLGRLSRSGPQIKVSCGLCGRYQYFAPLAEIRLKGFNPDAL